MAANLKVSHPQLCMNGRLRRHAVARAAPFLGELSSALIPIALEIYVSVFSVGITKLQEPPDGKNLLALVAVLDSTT